MMGIKKMGLAIQPLPQFGEKNEIEFFNKGRGTFKRNAF
jgi:hypothetical protein